MIGLTVLAAMVEIHCWYWVSLDFQYNTSGHIQSTHCWFLRCNTI